jgi:hypothetical protein
MGELGPPFVDEARQNPPRSDTAPEFERAAGSTTSSLARACNPAHRTRGLGPVLERSFSRQPFFEFADAQTPDEKSRLDRSTGSGQVDRFARRSTHASIDACLTQPIDRSIFVPALLLQPRLIMTRLVDACVSLFVAYTCLVSARLTD